MPDSSMFGRPSQHLLPSSSTNPDVSLAASDSYSAPPSFTDFRFNSIGKQPELLSRISLPQPDHASYHSLTPSPTPTPPPAVDAFQFRLSSRPTLFQQLAGNGHGTAEGDAQQFVSTSQSNGSLASRIQMNSPSSNATLHVANSATHGNATVHDAWLIPPVEVLPQTSEPSPISPTSSIAPVSEFVSSAPLTGTIAAAPLHIPTPPASTTNTTFSESSRLPEAAVGNTIRDPKPSSTVVPVTDSLGVRKERLQAISANLRNLSPLPSLSSSPDMLSTTPADNDITVYRSTQPGHGSASVILNHPTPGSLELGANGIPTSSSDSSLVVSSSSSLEEYQSRQRVLLEAMQTLTSSLDAFHRVQLDFENMRTLDVRTFEEQRTAFEQKKREQEAILHREREMLHQECEELNAREASFASLEKEREAREVARKAVLAKRQVQEEEKRAAEAKRMQEVQGQIAAAMKELNEFNALKVKGHLNQLSSEPASDDLPIEPREGMSEEEIATVKYRNELLCAVKHLRRMHTDKVQKLDESNHTLRRLEEERRQSQTKEADHRRIAEEECSRAHAETEQARQLLDEKRNDEERKRQEVENNRTPAQSSADQQGCEVHAHGARTGVASNQTSGHRIHPGEASTSWSQSMTDTERILPLPDVDSHSPETTNATSVGDVRSGSAVHRAIPSTDNAKPGSSHNLASQSKPEDITISGGVMLPAPAPQISGALLPPKPSAALSSLSSPDDVTKGSRQSVRTSPAISTGQESSFPAQLASEFNRVNANMRSTPEHRPRTTKSQTVLDATNRINQVFNIEPASHVSPTQRNVNLRHLKRSRGRVEESDTGDCSARLSSVKIEDDSLPVKGEPDNQPRVPPTLVPAIPLRPAIIRPPRVRLSKKPEVSPTPQIDMSSSFQRETRESSWKREMAEVTTVEQPGEAASGGPYSSLQAKNTATQVPGSADAAFSGSACSETRPSESRIDAGQRSIPQGRIENYDTELGSAITVSREGEDLAKSDRRFADEHQLARKSNKSRSRHPASPIQSRRVNDSWRPTIQAAPSGYAEPMRAASPTWGKKRPFESEDNEPGRRARRRGDVWISPDYDRDRLDPYHPNGGFDPKPDVHLGAHRTPAPLLDPTWSYGSDAHRGTRDSHACVSPEEPTARWEQPYYRRPGNDGINHRQPISNYNAVDQSYSDDPRAGQTYEPVMGERMDAESDPSLLARISSTQYFPPASNSRGRGKGESNRGRGDPGRGRVRGGGIKLYDRLKPSSSLGDRLT